MDKKKKNDDERKALTESEIKDTFSKLGLDNPQVLRYLQGLQTLGAEQPPQRVWYGADSGTRALAPAINDAQLERDP